MHETQLTVISKYDFLLLIAKNEVSQNDIVWHKESNITC